MTDLVYTDAAERDLTQIASHIAADNPRAARRFIERIREHCAHLVRFPNMGRQRRDIHPDIRSLAHGSYVIYYRSDDDLVKAYILRIWHGRRRIPTAADLL